MASRSGEEVRRGDGGESIPGTRTGGVGGAKLVRSHPVYCGRVS